MTADGSFRVHGKSSNGEGSIYRDADGSWRATFTVPGEARPRRVRGRTREEAIARRAAKLEELAQTVGGTFDRDMTLADLAAWWLDTIARHRVRPSTFGKYTDRVARITATLGHMPVRAVKAEHVARWQSELLKSGLSSGTVGDVRVTLRQVREQAIIHELAPANARYVGHAGEATTAGYVRSLGERPRATAATAAALLDPARQPRGDRQVAADGEQR